MEMIRTTTDADNILTIWMDAPDKPINTCSSQFLNELAEVIARSGLATWMVTGEHPGLADELKQRPGVEMVAAFGQTLHVISGVGRVQAKGGPIREIKAGDTVWIPPGEKHWHGAGPNTGMVHIAMQESLDGKHVEWMELVTDEEYGKPIG